MVEQVVVTTAPAPGASLRDFALVRLGAITCALPHGEPLAEGEPGRGRIALRRVTPWHQPTPVPGTPAGLVLGVAPLADEEGIERIEVVVDLAAALQVPRDAGRPSGACILIYSDDGLTVGLAVDSLIGRVRLVPPAATVDLPFISGIVLRPEDGAEVPRYVEWRLVDVGALMQHLATLLRLPPAD